MYDIRRREECYRKAGLRGELRFLHREQQARRKMWDTLQLGNGCGKGNKLVFALMFSQQWQRDFPEFLMTTL